MRCISKWTMVNGMARLLAAGRPGITSVVTQERLGTTIYFQGTGSGLPGYTRVCSLRRAGFITIVKRASLKMQIFRKQPSLFGDRSLGAAGLNLTRHGSPVKSPIGRGCCPGVMGTAVCRRDMHLRTTISRFTRSNVRAGRPKYWARKAMLPNLPKNTRIIGARFWMILLDP